MNKSVIQDSIYWLNAFPSDNGVSYPLSPVAIVQGLPNPNYDKLIIYFVSYAQLHTGTDNTTKSRTIEAIDLRSAGEHNRYYFI